MSLYLDSSALLKLYLDEPDSDDASALLRSDPWWVTARHTMVEVRRRLARGPTSEERAKAIVAFTAHWRAMQVVELDRETCELAASVAEETQVRTLDALHVAAAHRAAIPVVTYDRKLGAAARALGLPVLGV